MRTTAVCLLGCLSLTIGCGPRFGPRADFGIVFYSPGAGNVDFGDAGLRSGLEQAGYPGQVATNLWTVSFNPAIDQALRVNAQLGGKKLARWIEQYSDKYPNRPIDLVGLSAGTGVSIWALEALHEGYKVDNVILLASSLSEDYDVSKAMRHVKGTLYNYYSSEDAILAIPMKLFGTIDAKFGVDGAGAVGLHPPRGEDRIVNIPWRPAYRKYGYNGGHTDGTSAPFVRAVLSKHILNSPPTAHAGEHATAAGRRTRPEPGN